MSKTVELEIAVAVAALGEEFVLPVSVHLPESWPARPIALFCAHGGTYSRRYWDFAPDGLTGYSFAEYFTSRGFAVVAFDELGAADSTRPRDPWRLTSFEAAAAHHDLAGAVTSRLSGGGLAADVGPARDLVTIGIGHSLGGYLTIRQQGQHETYDGVAILGWTNLGLSITPEFDAAREPIRRAVADIAAGVPRADIEQVLARELRARELPPAVSAEDHRSQVETNFYYDDVPREVIDANNAVLAAVVPRSPGPLQLAVNVPDIVIEDAASIRVPVFVGFGERDVSAHVRDEPAVYRASPNVTFQLLERSGHCHNFASTRLRQWAWIEYWAAAVAATTSPAPSDEVRVAG